MTINATAHGKWRLRAAALLIFLLGVAAGFLAPRAYRAWSGGHRQAQEQVLNKLNLTPEQETQVRQILSETREELRALRRESAPREREVRERADERLRRVLTPEQLQTFRSLMSERRGGHRGRD